MALTKSLGGSGGGGISQLTGDVTAGPGSGSQAATIANGAVDIAHLSATGTPSSSTYLRGDNTWATPAGGLTAQYTVWDPFIPDTSPHADTDEFTSSSTISNWTGVYTGDAGVVSDIATSVPKGMYFEAPTVQYKMRARMKAILSGDFTYHTAAVLNTHTPGGTIAAFAGILLADGTTAGTGKQTAAAIVRSGNLGGGHLISARLTWEKYGLDATSAVADTTEFVHSLTFIRLRRVSGAYSMAFSYDGELWHEHSISLLSGLTPTHAGLFFQNYTGETGSAKFLYFRAYATGTQYKTGALRTVYG